MSGHLSEHTIRRRLPTPIATAWHRVSWAQTDLAKIQRLCACNEILLRTLAAFLLPDYLRGPSSKTVERALRDLQPPTDGKWLQLVRELIRYLGQRTDPLAFVPEAHDWYFAKDGAFTEAANTLHETVHLRNRVIHKGSASETDTRNHSLKLLSAVRTTLLSLHWMVGYRPFRVRKSDPVRRVFEGRVQFLVSSEEQEDIPAKWQSNVFLSKNLIYLTNPQGSGLLSLSPFLEFLPDPHTGEERLYLMKAFPDLEEIELRHDGSGSDGAASEVRKPFGEDDLAFEAWRAQSVPDDFYRSLGKGNEILRGAAADQPPPGEDDLGDRFKRLSELGRGGMAIVYRVHDTRDSSEAALKVLNAEFLEEATLRERFKREEPAMKSAKHPCIVPVLDYGTLPDGRPWLKMPVLAGNLQEQIIDGGQPEEAVRGWAGNALEALERVHSVNLVHRDIKPSNFLLSADRQVRLTDFGIALNRDADTITKSVDQIGTVMYMAPEQKRHRVVTGKADIYSLGIVLHELMTGHLPDGEVGADIGGEFGELIRWMGETDARKRPTAAEALVKLHDIRKSAPATPVPAVRKGRPKKPATGSGKRKRTPSVVAPPRPVGDSYSDTQRLHDEQRRTTERRTAARKSARDIKIAAVAILLLLFAANFAETAIESWLRVAHRVGIETEGYLGGASMTLEPDLGFEENGTSNPVLYIGYSIIYFFLFPLLGLVTVAVFLRHREPLHLLMLATAVTVNYALTLPFYIFFPVPERWTYPDANAVLLSDLWRSDLIEWFRPISGLNNCFPSFHVSLTVVLVLCLHRARVPFRSATIPIGLAIIISTFVLGIHWVPDVIAGVGLGITSVWIADRLLRARVPLRILGSTQPAPA